HMLAEDRAIEEPIFTWLADHFPEEAPALSGDAASSRRTAPSGQSQPSGQSEPSGMFDQLQTMSAGEHRAQAASVDMTVTGQGSQTLSWDRLAGDVDALAAGLHQLGVRAGDRISLLVQPGNDLTVILYASLRIGAVVVVVDAGLGLRGMTRAAQAARPDWIIGETAGLAVARSLRWPGHRLSVRELSGARAAALGTIGSVDQLLRAHAGEAVDRPLPAAEDPAAVLFTSGSTGPAKGVQYTHGRLSALVRLVRGQFGVAPGTSLLAGFAPFALLGPAIGATSVTPDMVVTKPSTLSAVAVAEAAEAGGATMLFASPAALRNIVATAAELSASQRRSLEAVTLVLSAGAPVHPDLLDAVQEVFPGAELHTPYGMTEGLLQADITREQIHEALEQTPAQKRAGVCVGHPVQGVQFALAPLEEDGTPSATPQDPAQATGVLGEILVSAGHLTSGYDALWFTDRSSRRDSDAHQRWHRTNDVGHFDESGRLWIQGRLQHTITTPQGPIGPGHLETPVDALPAVARSAAVGVGPRGTQAVAVVVEPEGSFEDAITAGSPLASADLAAAVREAAGSTDIAAVLVKSELPTDIRHNSKIDRTSLASWASHVLSGGSVKQR
ncbi:MAG TPA: AMP-binding protein, partial [Candidatus Nesterenkonia stercoripullorum]|nr:AMP-binding protein [Candidatus Nesterenkonia stercoripullorum]